MKRLWWRASTYKIDLVGAVVGLVSSCKTKERVFRSLGHDFGREICSRNHFGRDVTNDGVETRDGGR
jgi:hypothetical protein